MSWNEFSKLPPCPSCGVNGSVYVVPKSRVSATEFLFCSRYSGGCGRRFTAEESKAEEKRAS